MRDREQKARAIEVCVRVKAVVDQIVGPYVRDGVATIEQVEWDDGSELDIHVIPSREKAAEMTICPMLDWVSLSVEHGNLEIYIGTQDWEEELAIYLQSVLEGNYREIGKKARLGPGVKMIFGRPGKDDLTCTAGGLHHGAEHDYPPGERQYSPYR